MIEFSYVKTNGVNIHIATAGPTDGPLVILLHGFPEFWYGWRNQIEVLAHTGYRVMIPDQRGYNQSEKPRQIDKYTLDELRDDVIGLIQSAGHTSATIIGHDWGGAVGWHLAATQPECVKKLIVINIPHPLTMKKVLMKSPLQWIRSSYIAFFQLKRIPEKLLHANNYLLLKKAMINSARPHTFEERTLLSYTEAWSQPYALTSMLRWYRAIRRGSVTTIRKRVRPQVLILWGKDDLFLSSNLAYDSLEYCENGKAILIEEAGHWVIHEQPSIVNKLIISFLTNNEH